MDARLTLPVLLLLLAVGLTGAVDSALRSDDGSFRVGPPAGAATLSSLTIAGPFGASPQLEWADPPDGTRALVLIAEDLDAPATATPFWVLMPEALEAGTEAGAQGTIDPAQPGYRAPSLAAVARHRLRFSLYALATIPAESGQVAADGRLPIDRAWLDAQALGVASWHTGGGWVR